MVLVKFYKRQRVKEMLPLIFHTFHLISFFYYYSSILNDYLASLYNYAQNYVGLKWTALSDARFISDFDSSLVCFSVFHLIYFSVSVLFV